jgi:hypothetical protein
LVIDNSDRECGQFFFGHLLLDERAKPFDDVGIIFPNGSGALRDRAIAKS